MSAQSVHARQSVEDCPTVQLRGVGASVGEERVPEFINSPMFVSRLKIFLLFYF